jgi:hypothetical protein
MDEPLCHKKTALAFRALGLEEVNRLTALCREFNGR